MRPLFLLACMLTLLSAAGCGNACEDLAAQVCLCLPDDGTRQACNDRAKQQEANFPIRSQDQQYCQHQLDTGACDCNQLNTPEGKQGCGLAWTGP